MKWKSAVLEHCGVLWLLSVCLINAQENVVRSNNDSSEKGSKGENTSVPLAQAQFQSRPQFPIPPSNALDTDGQRRNEPDNPFDRNRNRNRDQDRFENTRGNNRNRNDRFETSDRAPDRFSPFGRTQRPPQDPFSGLRPSFNDRDRNGNTDRQFGTRQRPGTTSNDFISQRPSAPGAPSFVPSFGTDVNRGHVNRLP